MVCRTGERILPLETENAQITRGAELVRHFAKAETCDRQYCAKCGGYLITDHPVWGIVNVFAATLPTLAFAPGVHLNYAETVLPMTDGLPKFRDFTAELGGFGERMAEWNDTAQRGGFGRPSYGSGTCTQVGHRFACGTGRTFFVRKVRRKRSQRPLKIRCIARRRAASAIAT